MFNKIKNNKMLRHCLLVWLDILSVVNCKISKNEYKILFYDSLHSSLEDNTEAFYNWLKVNKYDEKYKLKVCVPNRKDKISGDNSLGCIRGVYEFLTSKYIFYSFGDFRIKPSRNQVVVNLWHGTPLKKIGKLSNDKNLLSEKIDNFTYILAASELFVPIMAEAFGCKSDSVKVLGHTRNDYLFSTKDVLSKIGLDNKKYEKYILWMPTFRQSKDSRFVDSDSSNTETMLPILDSYKKLIDFDKKLQVLNILLVIKIHPYAKFKDIQLRNILMMKNEDILPKGVKLYEFVKEFDALITDYSSIYFDFMLLNRPIGFTLDDYQSYVDKRGFVFDKAVDFMPGKHIYCVKDMESFVVSIKNELDEFKSKRQELLPKICKYTDGNNCQRLADEVGIKI